MNYYILDKDPTNKIKYCILDRFPKTNETHKPARGIPFLDDYKKTWEFQFSDDLGGTMLRDSIRNIFGYLIVSTKFKELLAKEDGSDIEFVPIDLIDRDQKVIANEFYIANVINRNLDCEDFLNTDWEEDSFAQSSGDDYYENLTRLNLLTDKIPTGFKIFRLAHMPRVIIVNEELKTEIEKTGLTGVKFQELDTSVIIS